jgi:uncharacterized protein (TIGR02145 family)
MKAKLVVQVFISVFLGTRVLGSVDTLHVLPGVGTLQVAIDNAESGDVLMLHPGTYSGPESFLIQNKSLFIVGLGLNSDVILSGEHTRRVLYIQGAEVDTVSVSNLTIRDGRPSTENHASALWVVGCSAHFQSVIVEHNGGGTGNTVAFGSGVNRTRFSDCIVRYNTVENYAGLREATVERTLLHNNAGWNNTGVLALCNSINCTVVGNGGGAGNPWTTSGVVDGSALNCVFWNNSAQSVYNSSNVTYCLNASVPGTGNFSGSPGFVPGTFDLDVGSICINAGNPAPVYNDADGSRNDLGWKSFGYLGVAGCTDPTACNYNPEANADDGSCLLSGCTDAAACNFDADAGCDDGSCAPADAVVGCMEPGACNFNAAAVCAGTCVYPAAGLADCVAGGALCGDGMVWDVAAQTCTIDTDFVTGAIDAAVAEALDGVCGPGTVWDINLGMCTSAGPTATCASDLNGNGAVEIQDLLILLSEFATLCPVPEPIAIACGDLSSVSFDGYSYPLVAIGSQCWFQENLRSDNYRNGDPIPGGLSDAEWTSTTAGAQAVYNEDPANLELYGRLYNWYAVNDARGLCPTGWHVPSDGEWTELENELGGASIAGTALKSSSNDVPPWDGTNSSGFSALPSAHRNDETGNFVDLGNACSWWSHSPNAQRAWMRDVFNNQPHIGRASYQLSYGFSVRCLRD